MKVWVATHGELHEGGRVVSIHKNKENAIKIALKQRCCFAGGWRDEGDDAWVNGCDFVMVQGLEVEK